MKKPESIEVEEKAWDLYRKETNRIVNDLVGKYGNRRVKDSITNENVRNRTINLINDIIYDSYKNK